MSAPFRFRNIGRAMRYSMFDANSFLRALASAVCDAFDELVAYYKIGWMSCACGVLLVLVSTHPELGSTQASVALVSGIILTILPSFPWLET